MNNTKPKDKIIGYDASGVPITEERVMKYHELIKTCILIIFPKGYCREAGSSFECLYNMGVIHVIKSFFKFHGGKALTSVTTDQKRKRKKDSEQLQWKQENPVAALAQVEKAWVKKKLLSEFRRHRWDHSEKGMGGSSVPFDWNRMQAECQASEMADNGEAYSFGWKSSYENIAMRDFGEAKPTLGIDYRQVEDDLAQMVKLSEGGLDKALEFFKTLPKDRREDLKEYYFMDNDQESVRQNALAQFFMQEETRIEAGGLEMSGSDGGSASDDDEYEGYDN